MSFEGKTILVVGASGVLGAQIANILATGGARVLGTATSNESAAKLPSSIALGLLLDLQNDSSIATLCDYLNSAEKLDGIVLASGRVGFGPSETVSAENTQALMQVNFLGQSNLVTRLRPAMQPESFVAAITGVVAERSFPGMAAYCASKSAMSVWLQASSAEFRKAGIRLLEARPGHTETGLATRPLFGTAPQMPLGMEPNHVATKIVEAISNGTTVLSSADF
jgi:NAD(P)-dependent dehydrogenase (short-subunit alcohol dehydrogenase family)